MPEYTRRRQFEAKSHLTYGPTSRTAKPGDVLDGLPTESISWLLEQGHIAELPDNFAPPAKPSLLPFQRRSPE